MGERKGGREEGKMHFYSGTLLIVQSYKELLLTLCCVCVLISYIKIHEGIY